MTERGSRGSGARSYQSAEMTSYSNGRNGESAWENGVSGWRGGPPPVYYEESGSRYGSGNGESSSGGGNASYGRNGYHGGSRDWGRSSSGRNVSSGGNGNHGGSRDWGRSSSGRNVSSGGNGRRDRSGNDASSSGGRSDSNRSRSPYGSKNGASSSGGGNASYEENGNRGGSRNRRSSKERDAAVAAALAAKGLTPGDHRIQKIVPARSENAPSKRGTLGTPVNLLSNYFQITKKPTLQLYLYRVDFSPEIEIRSLKSGLLFDKIKNSGLSLFDGSMLYLTKKLDFAEFTAKTKKDEIYQIKVKLVGLVLPDTYQYNHVWSVLLRKCEKELGLQLVGRNYYDPKARIVLHQAHLELWPGYVTSIRQHERDVLLCAEISTKVVRQETALHVLLDCRNRNGDEFVQVFTNKILGKTVVTAYNNRQYTVSDVDFNRTPESTFAQKNGTIVSFAEYYKNRYQKDIRDMYQPMLISKTKERERRAGQAEFVLLVPELCVLTGFDDDMRNNSGLMRTVANVTNVNPRDRIDRLNNFCTRIRSTNQDNFKQWGFDIGNQLVQVRGRRLPNERIMFGGGQIHRTDDRADWSQQLRNIQMYDSRHLKNWILIYPGHIKVSDFVRTLQQAARSMSYTINDPKYVPMSGDRGDNYNKALNEAKNQDPQLIMCVLMSQKEDIYSIVKKFCFHTHAIPSQCVTAKNIKPDKKLMSICTKIGIQINAKLGGVPWMVAIEPNGLMIVGFDVFHDKKNKKTSYGAMVATMGEGNRQRYFSSVSPHDHGGDLSNDFAMHILQALNEFKGANNTLPERILIYRDGVGDGQIEHVKDIEIKNIIARLKDAYGDRTVPLDFVIVTKRINTRLFENKQNPRAGTIVDDVITIPEWQDFFLVSQYVKHGTVSPTRYNVIHNESGFTTDQLQQLTYKTTHLYYHMASTIPVPAVCRYAHRLAFMVGSYLHQIPSNSDLQKKLYFL